MRDRNLRRNLRNLKEAKKENEMICDECVKAAIFIATRNAHYVKQSLEELLQDVLGYLESVDITMFQVVEGNTALNILIPLTKTRCSTKKGTSQEIKAEDVIKMFYKVHCHAPNKKKKRIIPLHKKYKLFVGFEVQNIDQEVVLGKYIPNRSLAAHA